MTHPHRAYRSVLFPVLALAASACTDQASAPHPTGPAFSRSGEQPFSARCEASIDQEQQTNGQTVVRGDGTCQITHLGKSRYVLSLTVDPDLASVTGTVTFTAANGDVLFATLAGPFASNASLATLQATATLTGGTGRFISATGSATFARGIGSGLAIDIYSGTIDYDASGRTPPPAVAIEVAPAAVLLPGAGAQRQLTAYAVDAAGARTPIAATFQSSRPGTVSVTAGGLATALVTTGSSQIVASANGLTSAPVLVLVATPAAGALLVGDDQIEGPLTAVDPGVEYGVGWRGRVRLLGVNPGIGQIVLGTGGFSLGGLITAVTALGPGVVEIEVELVPLGALFSALAVNEQIPLANPLLSSPGGSSPALGLAGLRARGLESSPAPGASSTRPTLPIGDRPSAALVEFTFNLGAFKCEAKVDAGVSIPITLDLLDFQIDADLTLDVIVSGTDVERYVVHGTIDHRLSANPRLSGSIKGSFECKLTAKTILLPIPGPLGVFLGGQVPLGIGFALELKTDLAGFGFDAFHQGQITAALGFDCTSECQPVTDLTSTAGGFFKSVIPPVFDDLKSELAGSFFAWAELTIGNHQSPALQFKILEAKSALEEKAELATERVQALDDAYASRTQLAPVIEVSLPSKVSALKGLINVQLPSLKLAPPLQTIAESPKGTLQISPSTVEAGNSQALGEKATFTVTLDPVTYVGSYAVEAVEIRWLRTDGQGNPVLEPGRPGCSAFQAVANQAVFTCDTDFLEEHEGEQTFFAFVKPRLYGQVLPISLEVGKATVTVTKPAAITVTVLPNAVTLLPGETQQFTAQVTGTGNTGVVWSATGGTISSAGLYTAGTTPGTHSVVATSVADPGAFATATVTINASSLAGAWQLQIGPAFGCPAWTGTADVTGSTSSNLSATFRVTSVGSPLCGGYGPGVDAGGTLTATLIGTSLAGFTTWQATWEFNDVAGDASPFEPVTGFMTFQPCSTSFPPLQGDIWQSLSMFVGNAYDPHRLFDMRRSTGVPQGSACP